MLHTLAVKHTRINGWTFEQLLLNLFGENQKLNSFCCLQKFSIPPTFAQKAPLFMLKVKNNSITPLGSPRIVSVLFIHFVYFGGQGLQA